MDCHPTWSNLGQRASVDTSDAISSAKLRGLTAFSILVAVFPVLHTLAHGALKRWARPLDEGQRVAASHHLVEALVGTIGTPFAFAAARRLLFCQPDETFTTPIIDTSALPGLDRPLDGPLLCPPIRGILQMTVPSRGV